MPALAGSPSAAIPAAPLQITFPLIQTGGATSFLQIAETAISSSRQLAMSLSTSNALKLELPASPGGPAGPVSPRSPRGLATDRAPSDEAGRKAGHVRRWKRIVLAGKRRRRVLDLPLYARRESARDGAGATCAVRTARSPCEGESRRPPNARHVAAANSFEQSAIKMI
jgi:hypothetical protein